MTHTSTEDLPRADREMDPAHVDAFLHTILVSEVQSLMRRWLEEQAHPLHPNVTKIEYIFLRKGRRGPTKFDARDILDGSIEQKYQEYCDHEQSALLSLTNALKEGGDLRKITIETHPKGKDLRNRVTSR